MIKYKKNILGELQEKEIIHVKEVKQTRHWKIEKKLFRKAKRIGLVCTYDIEGSSYRYESKHQKGRIESMHTHCADECEIEQYTSTKIERCIHGSILSRIVPVGDTVIEETIDLGPNTKKTFHYEPHPDLVTSCYKIEYSSGLVSEYTKEGPLHSINSKVFDSHFKHL